MSAHHLKNGIMQLFMTCHFSQNKEMIFVMKSRDFQLFSYDFESKNNYNYNSFSLYIPLCFCYSFFNFHCNFELTKLPYRVLVQFYPWFKFYFSFLQTHYHKIIFLDFHSTKQGMPLVDSWSCGLD